MKLLILCLGLFFNAASPAVEDVSYTLTLNVSGLPSDKGKLLVALYNKKDGFRENDRTYRNLSANAVKGTVTLSFKELPAGTYAAAIFHDENANAKLDKNFLGIPTEKYGFSNDAMGNFGPPDYEECTFTVSSDKTISIKLK